MEAYDDTPRKVSWFSLVWKCGHVVSKSLLLIREFYRKFTVPQKVLQEVFEAQNGEDRIASTISNPFILLHLEVFAIALSIHFSIFVRELERANSDNMPVSQGALSEFELHTTPIASLTPPFENCFAHTCGDITSPSVTAPPLYSFELDTAREHTRLATSDGTNDTLTMMKGVNHDKEE